jgi:hypothetical protein
MDGLIPPRRLRLLYGRVPSRFSSTAAIVMTAAGSHQLTFTVTGKNPASANYLVGLDYLVFTLQ